MKNNKSENALAKFFNSHRKGCIIGGAVALFLIIGCIAAAASPSEPTDTNKKEETKTTDTSKQEEKIEGTNLTESAVEEACQDAKYNRYNGYDIILATNYNFGVFKTGDTDEAGNPMLMVRWNGKDKSTKETVMFICYVSGSSDDNITEWWIKANNTDIWKSEADYNYNAFFDGKRISEQL